MLRRLSAISGGSIPSSYYVPIHKWILTLMFNGMCYAFFGAIIQSLIKKKA